MLITVENIRIYKSLSLNSLITNFKYFSQKRSFVLFADILLNVDVLALQNKLQILKCIKFTNV